MMKKLAGVFAIFLVAVFAVSFASAITVTLEPSNDSYINEDDPTDNYGSDDRLKVGNDSGDTKRALVSFDLSSLPLNITITSATLYMYNFNQVGPSGVHAAQRILSSWNESGVNWNNAPSFSTIQSATAITSTGENFWMTWDLTDDVSDFHDGSLSNYGWLFKDTEETGDRKVVYYSNESSENETLYLEVEYDLEVDPKVSCSVDHLTYPNGTVAFDLVDYYFNTAGDFFVAGTSEKDACSLEKIATNSSSSPSWSLGYLKLITGNWSSSGYDHTFSEGLNTACCEIYAETSCSTGKCEVISNQSCTEFCIDSIAPDSPSVYYSDTCDNSDDHFNGDIIFTWTNESDSGCAAVEYMVEIYEGGELVHSYNTSETSVNISEVYGQTNGYNYSIKVKSYDLAGNSNNVWINSTTIWFDSENPVVNVIGQPYDAVVNSSYAWYNDDFFVNESDTDNLGLYKCEYKIRNNGTDTLNWAEFPCGDPYDIRNINISEYCPLDGLNSCYVSKRISDLACNTDTESHYWDLDVTAPNTTKTVSNPKYTPWGNWSLWLVNGWFVTNETQFTFSCNDNELSGCNATYYNVTYTDNGTVVYNTTSYSGAFNLPNVDANYTIIYWSVDNVGNVETWKYEIDKLDNIAPETNKTYDLFVYGWRIIEEFEDLLTWMRFISPDTNITLEATDTQVGVNTTYFQILVPGEDEQESESGEDEWYGNETQYWYESLDECIDAGNDEELCFETYWEVDNDAVTNYGNIDCDDEWCVYEGPVQVEESEHKICYYSVDHLGNEEEVSCQVFSVDGTAPTVYILNPDESYAEGNLANACVMVLDVKLDDEKVGVASGYAVLEDENESVVWEGNLSYIRTQNGTEYWGYPGSVDLTGLPAGNYTLRIFAEDHLGNVNEEETRDITLNSGLFVPNNWVEGCSVGEEGGICEIQFTACARNVTDMDFVMTNIFDQEDGIDYAGVLELNATVSTDVDGGYAGQLNSDSSVDPSAEIILLDDLDCEEVVNDRINFNLTLNFSEDLVDNIGTGNYYFDWTVGAHNDVEPCILP